MTLSLGGDRLQSGDVNIFLSLYRQFSSFYFNFQFLKSNLREVPEGLDYQTCYKGQIKVTTTHAEMGKAANEISLKRNIATLIYHSLLMKIM